MGASKPFHPKPSGTKGMDEESYQMLQVKDN